MVLEFIKLLVLNHQKLNQTLCKPLYGKSVDEQSVVLRAEMKYHLNKGICLFCIFKYGYI